LTHFIVPSPIDQRTRRFNKSTIWRASTVPMCLQPVLFLVAPLTSIVDEARTRETSSGLLRECLYRTRLYRSKAGVMQRCMDFTIVLEPRSGFITLLTRWTGVAIHDLEPIGILFGGTPKDAISSLLIAVLILQCGSPRG
jgi:hypothetical protein